MKIVNIKFIIEYCRFNFDRSMEVARHAKVQWLLGWLRGVEVDPKSFINDNHKIKLLGRGDKVRRRFLGVYDELRFTIAAIKELGKQNPDLVLVHSHRFAFLYPFLKPNYNYLFIAYTTSVSPSKLKNLLWDSWERLVMWPYKHFLIATPQMQDLFGLQHKKCYVRRWGMKPLTQKNKSFSTLKLLYIGVISGRRVHETIGGLKLFMDKHSDVEVAYSIIGRGKEEDVQLLNRAIADYQLSEVVTYHGYLPDSDIGAFFEECNVGVSYVPITPYYTDVIVTKTVEYLLSGLAVIATNTNKNREDINDANGVLIEDSPIGFAQGLENICANLNSYDSEVIRASAKRWNLEDNVRDNLVPLFKELARKGKE